MTETLQNSTERNVHEDYRNILHYVVAAAQLESEAEVVSLKITDMGTPSPATAMKIAAVRTRARINFLADAIYETKHFRPRVKEIAERDPDSLQSKAYKALMNAREHNDFGRIPNDPETAKEIAATLHQVPEAEKAELKAQQSLRRDGEAPHDMVQAYHASAFILKILPRLPISPFEETSLPAEVSPPIKVSPIPHQMTKPSVGVVA